MALAAIAAPLPGEAGDSAAAQGRYQEVIVEERQTIMESGPNRRPFDVTRHTIPLDEILGGGPPIDGIPALGLSAAPRFVPHEQAGWLEDDDRVIGVRLGEHVRAYPIKMLNWHEVANDAVTVEGSYVPFAVVY